MPFIAPVAQADHGAAGDTLSLQEYYEEYPSLPINGLTKEAVLVRFGESQQKIAAVGKPPISRWHYPDYVVYFEWNRVIIAVPNQR